MDDFVTRHPFIWTSLSFAIGTLPQWVASIWSLYSKEPLVPYLGRRFGLTTPKWWYPYLVTVPLAVAMFGYLLFQAMNFSNGSTVNDAIPAPAIALEEIRKNHHLRPLSDIEDGITIEKVPSGIYGFSMCTIMLRTRPTSFFSLEIHKHYDETIYYVGFVSNEHAGKFAAHQKHFDITVYPQPWEGASSIIEIPGDLVSRCQVRPFRRSYTYDLFLE